MTQPTLTDVHVNAPLTNISIAFLQSANNFVADKVFPNIPVSKASDKYYTYDRGSFNRNEAEIRAPGTESAGGGYDLSTATYNAEVYAFHKDIHDHIRSNADAVLDQDREATEYVTHKMLIKKEKVWATNNFTGGVWGYDYDGVASSAGSNQTIQWSDASSSDPIIDVRNGSTEIQKKTGFKPNTMVVGLDVHNKLLDHPDIVDRIKYGQSTGNVALVTEQIMADLFDVERYMVMRGIENTADEGQTATHSFIGGKKALLCYAAPTPGIMTPSAGYTFSWTGYLGNNALGIGVRKYRMENLRSDRVEAEMAFDAKLVSSDLGAFWDSIVA